jgi:hypothetical protein
MHHSSLCLLSAFGNFLLEVPGGGRGFSFSEEVCGV